MKNAIITGAVHGFIAVALGAFGAHALKNILDDYSTGIWDTAVQYQMFHAAALILIGILMSDSILGEVKQLKIAKRCINAGIIFFAGMFCPYSWRVSAILNRLLLKWMDLMDWSGENVTKMERGGSAKCREC